MSIISENKNNIKVLDCTLRDGGYVNSWFFKQNSIDAIIKNLADAGIEYVECGFLQQKKYSTDYTLFSDVFTWVERLPKSYNTIFSLMINYGEFPIGLIPVNRNEKIALRVAFKKFQMLDALDYCKQLADKGYKVFVNPMHTNIYTMSELSELVKIVNGFEPYALSIVDTNGAMQETEVLSIYTLLAENISQKISLCFHSHNNLQLSLANAKCLIESCADRELIIDSTLMGIGRGAGNLCTEVLVRYLNENYFTNYDINLLFAVIDQYISPIYKNTPWGHSLYYYLAALNNCHPNYAKYLMDKDSVSLSFAKEFFSSMPLVKKTMFDKDFVESHLLSVCK